MENNYNTSDSLDSAITSLWCTAESLHEHLSAIYSLLDSHNKSQPIPCFHSIKALCRVAFEDFAVTEQYTLPQINTILDQFQEDWGRYCP